MSPKAIKLWAKNVSMEIAYFTEQSIKLCSRFDVSCVPYIREKISLRAAIINYHVAEYLPFIRD